MEILSNVNWLATGVGTVVAFLLGWAWYSEKLFGTKWAEGSGVDLGNIDQMPVFAMVTQVIGLLLLATVIGITRISEDIVTAVIAILAAATLVASGGAFSQKSGYAIRVEFSYIVVAGIIMIACQGILS